jgi:hypothetical protein
MFSSDRDIVLATPLDVIYSLPTNGLKCSITTLNLLSLLTLGLVRGAPLYPIGEPRSCFGDGPLATLMRPIHPIRSWLWAAAWNGPMLAMIRPAKSWEKVLMMYAWRGVREQPLQLFHKRGLELCSPFDAGRGRAHDEMVISFLEFPLLWRRAGRIIFGVVPVCLNSDWEMTMAVLRYEAGVDGGEAGSCKRGPRH